MRRSLFDLLNEPKQEQKEEAPMQARHCHLEKGNPEDENNMYYLLQNYRPALGKDWEKAERYIDFYCFQGVCYNVTSK